MPAVLRGIFFTSAQRTRSSFRILPARGATPNEIGPARCCTTPAITGRSRSFYFPMQPIFPTGCRIFFSARRNAEISAACPEESQANSDFPTVLAFSISVTSLPGRHDKMQLSDRGSNPKLSKEVACYSSSSSKTAVAALCRLSTQHHPL